MFVGPSLTTSGGLNVPEILSGVPEGLRVTRQSFEDGEVYEIRTLRGAPFEAVQAGMQRVPAGAQLMSVHCPLDVQDDDEHLYIAAWVARAAA
jgi:hypothetical protein